MDDIALDVAQYDRVVDLLYAAAMDSERWGGTLEHLQKLFQANYVTLILRAPDETEMGLMISVGLEGEQGGGKVTYLTYMHTATPFVNMPTDRVFTEEDVMSPRDWHSCAYFQHWCKPHDVFHVMGADIATHEAGRLRFRLTRGEAGAAFSAADRRLCEMLLPHLQRALNIQNSLNRSESMGALYSRAIGRLSVATVVLDERGTIIDQNLMAREILARGDGLKVVGGRLEASYPSNNKQLHQLIRNAFALHSANEVRVNEAMSLARPSGEVDLGVVVEAIPDGEWAEGKGRPAVVLYIRDAASSSFDSMDVGQKLYGLTPAECALAKEMANGLSLDEAAESLNIRRNTARAHLRSIFSKTGVRRQTELVRIMLNSVAALTRSD